MELVQQASPFDHDDWLFEIKHDGFRALAYIENGACKLVSRNDNDYKRFADLAAVMPSDIRAKSAILDGELTNPVRFPFGFIRSYLRQTCTGRTGLEPGKRVRLRTLAYATR